MTAVGVGLAPSPLPHRPGAEHHVRESTALVHPQPRFDRPGWCGYHVHGRVLHLNDPAAMAWLPVGEIDDLPDGRWVRITTADGRLVVPFELRRHGDDLEGRWLDGTGEIIGDAPVPVATPAGHDPELDPERYAPGTVMDRWLSLGGWHRMRVW